MFNGQKLQNQLLFSNITERLFLFSQTEHSFSISFNNNEI